ncbi:MAG: hypothetical protein ACYCW6_10950 [Candidatus Xenobia bacterium]
MTPRSRGMALAGLLGMIALMVVLGLGIASYAIYHMTTARQTTSRYRAREAALAGLSRAAAHLAGNPQWGLHGEALDGALADGSQYHVTFQSGQPCAWSANNLSTPSSVAGYKGQVVPGYSALMVATGVAPDGQTLQLLETVLQPSPCPFALAATGLISATAPLQVLGAATAEDYINGNFTLPASVYGNGVSSQSAMTVSGRLESVTAPTLGPGSQVGGGIQQVSAQTLPDLDITQYGPGDQEENDGWTDLAAGTEGGRVEISGPTNVSGNLTLHGGATLNGATLYVDGNLESDGQIDGTGSIFVTGTTRLTGHQTFSATRNLAIFSGGGIQLDGGSLFQGSLYSHGNIAVKSPLDVVGAVVSQGGSVVLGARSRIVLLPQYAVHAAAATLPTGTSNPLQVISTVVVP